MNKIIMYVCLVSGFLFNAFTNADDISDDEMINDQLDIIFLNVPHGEATLISNEKNEHILINTASKKSQKTLHKQLTNLGIDAIETIIITNKDEEYTGNMNYFLNHYNVNKVLLPKQIDLEIDNRATVTKWIIDEVLQVWKYVSIQALDESEEGSITFLMRYRNESVLFLNNKDIAIENKILKTVKDIDILKIAEFGSGHSPSESFLELSDPSMSIIFRSEKHPINEALVERLHATWIDIYFLKQSGSVFVRLSKDDYEILTGNYSVST